MGKTKLSARTDRTVRIAAHADPGSGERYGRRKGISDARKGKHGAISRRLASAHVLQEVRAAAISEMPDRALGSPRVGYLADRRPCSLRGKQTRGVTRVPGNRCRQPRGGRQAA